MPVALAALLAALSTAAGIVQPPCVAACTPRLVVADELQRANAFRAAIGQGSIVAGPALGAVLLGLSSPAVVIALNAASFLASAAAITAIGGSPAFVPSREDGGPLRLGQELREGAQALRGAPAAVQLVVADMLCSATYGLLTVTLVLVSMRVGTGTGGYGLLLGMFGIGGVVGATVAGKLDAPALWRRMLLVALGLVAVAVAALGLVHSLAAAIVLSLAGGGGMIVAEVLSETALGRMLDDAVLARAYGLALPASLSGIVIGSLVAGPLVASVGVTATFLVAGGGLALASGLVLRHPLEDTSAPAVVVPAPAM
jgi:predicted MFS family arabinose efflux permease